MTRINLFIIAILVIAADFYTKYLVYTCMALHETIELPVKFIQLTYVQNFGGAFGIFQHQKLFFIAAAFVSVTCVLYFFEDIKELGKLSFLSASLIFGGAIGNLIDRIRFGYVVDFLDLRWWPVFNVADVALTIGVALLFIEVIRFGQKAPDKVEAEVAQIDKVEEQISAEEAEEERATAVQESATSEDITEAIESKLPPSQI
ncbi:MAG: signal peptidase II [Candidatus Bruticola sp.]